MAAQVVEELKTVTYAIPPMEERRKKISGGQYRGWSLMVSRGDGSAMMVSQGGGLATMVS